MSLGHYIFAGAEASQPAVSALLRLISFIGRGCCDFQPYCRMFAAVLPPLSSSLFD